MEYYAALKNVKISKSGSPYVPSEQNTITLTALSGTVCEGCLKGDMRVAFEQWNYG